MSSGLKNNGLRALSLDGGVVNVLSALIVLRELLRRVQALKNLPDIPLPSELFDIMGGTGMGGVMLILMGRLRLSIDLTLIYCVEILERVFTNKKWLSRDSVFSATNLEIVIGEIVAKHCGRADARMIDLDSQSRGCKVMVCARTADAIRAGIMTHIRSYRVPANQGPDCTIVEAARATTATPGIFKRAQIKEHGVTVSYIGGALECNNPTDKLLLDMSLIFPERPIACVLSIGSGQIHSVNVPESKICLAPLPSKLLPVVRAMLTDCEKTHQDLARRFEHTEDVYFRFNTEHGMQDINQHDLTKLPEVQAHAQVYLRDVRVGAIMNSAAKAIVNKKGLVRLQNSNLISLKRNQFGIGRCPPPCRAFTGRGDILKQMESYFFQNASLERHLYVLYGLGGAGKTQLALKFVHIHMDSVFYIDATTRETILSGLTSLAKAVEAGETPAEALTWLASQEERWLLLLNNADDTELNLYDFFPVCAHGDILITTRNQQTIVHTQGPGSYCRVGAMRPDDALDLLLKTSGSDHKKESTKIAKAFVEEVGYFALAIVQSGAYMRATQCGLAEYSRIFQKARARLLSERSIKQASDYQLSVFASWEISHRQLSSSASQLLHVMSFLHHEGISEDFFEVASAKAMSYNPDIPLSKSQVATKTMVFDFLSSLRTSTNEWDPLALKDLTSQLRSFSLIDYDTQSCSYSMHPLVQEWSRITATDVGTVRECAAWVLALCVNEQFGSGDYVFRRRLLPHLFTLESNHPQMVPELANRLRRVYYEAGYEKEYGALVAIALQASKDSLGNQHSATLTCMHNQAEAFRRQRRLEEAVALLTEVIKVRKRVLGYEHPETLTSMHNLALMYHDQKRWKEAEILFLEVIKAQKRVNGAEHRRTLTSMGMLASTYRSQGLLFKAAALEFKVLETTRRVLGREHPITLMAMHNLASSYDKLGKLQEANSMMEETVALRIKVLGSSHVETQNSIRFLEGIKQCALTGPVAL
ncbi:FabD/lysophospholipase-like protein [Ceratobasidium sp. AG-I]|nr:FabD/lysophospholipase-like protein [Ceratobasidium sp. AG-I]